MPKEALEMESRAFGPGRLQAGLALVLLGVIYAPAFVWMVERWREADSYYSHGFLVPFVSGFLLWRRRKDFALAARVGRGESGAALPLVAAGLLLQVLSALTQIQFFSGLSLIPLLLGLVGHFYGREVLKLAAFPVLFLFFMVPLPMILVAHLSFQLKSLASSGALALVIWTGIPAILRGSTIFTPHAKLLVGDVCSGLRSLISLLALGALFAYGLRGPLWKKAVILAAAAPIAVAVNSLRIYLLCLVAEIYGQDKATGFFHDLSGLLLFVLAFLLLEMVLRALTPAGKPQGVRA